MAITKIITTWLYVHMQQQELSYAWTFHRFLLFVAEFHCLCIVQGIWYIDGMVSVVLRNFAV